MLMDGAIPLLIRDEEKAYSNKEIAPDSKGKITME
jgi:hypothetical protein